MDYYKLNNHISNSSLGILKSDSPANFKKFLDGELEQEDKKYYEFGQLFHMYLLERNKFNNTVKVLEYTIPKSAQQKSFCEDMGMGKITDERLIEVYKRVYSLSSKDDTILKKATALYNKYKSYVSYLKHSKSYQVISKKEMAKLEEMEASIKIHSLASQLFKYTNSIIDTGIYTFNEVAFIWEDEDNIKYKALMDRVIVDESTKTITLIDLKTTSNVWQFESSFKKFDYSRQLAFYSGAIAKVGEKYLNLNGAIEEYTLNIYIVAVDKITSEVRVFEIPSIVIEAQAEELKELISRAKWHLLNDKWYYSKEYYLNNGKEVLQ